MAQFISTKELYSQLKTVSEKVQQGTTFIVLKHSKPVYKITPLEESTRKEKKYNLQNISDFIFTSKKKGKDLATTFKKHIYS